MADKSERVAQATLAWRKIAKAEFDSRGRGTRSLCAKELKVSRAAITRLLSGGTVSSVTVNRISDWLKIPRPSVPVANDQIAKLVDIASELDKAGVGVLLTMAEALKNK